MILYDLDKNIINFDKEKAEYVGSGRCADVYRYDNIRNIKIYYDYCDTRLTRDFYNVIKDIDNNHFVKVSNLLFKEKDNTEIIDGYLVEHYEEGQVNILEKDTNYLLDNMNEISKLFDFFTDSGIMVFDLKRANTVLKDDRIILIDPDLYFKSELSRDDIDSYNKRYLLQLFKELVQYDLGPKHFDDCYRLFFMCDYNVDIVSEISKRLEKCKTPMDYFIKNK